MTDLFILDDANNPIPMPESEFLEWGRWHREAEASGRRMVAETQIEAFRVWTFFGGCDNNWDGGTPVLFESRVSEGGEKRDLYLRRYTTWTDAEAGHEALCDQIRQEISG